MKRVAKPEGKFNIVIEEVAMPEPGPGEVRVKAVRSLISRGSEMGGRYTREHAVNPESMGYSLAGIVDAIGEGINKVWPLKKYPGRQAQGLNFDEIIRSYSERLKLSIAFGKKGR